jgi:hypothetical protein
LLVEAALPREPQPSSLAAAATNGAEAAALARAPSVRAAPSTTTTTTTTTTSASPFACRDTQLSVTQLAPGLTRLFLRCTSSMRRACPPTPHGMGPLPSLLTPSFTAASLSAARQGAVAAGRGGPVPHGSGLEAEWESFLVHEPGLPEAMSEGEEKVVAAAAGGRSAGQLEPREEDDDVGELHEHPHHRVKQHAALAAGVAAATSTVAAVSQAASAAASALAGMAVLGSGPSLTSSAVLLHLGTNVLNVGSSVLATKFQVRQGGDWT